LEVHKSGKEGLWVRWFILAVGILRSEKY